MEVQWRKKEDELLVDVSIPVNSEAMISLPVAENEVVREREMGMLKEEIKRMNGVRRMVIPTKSGEYNFHIKKV
ncbi:alpha-L-rhamnosidase C-terminal domain-containing protein [Alkalicoccobacillus plakortidis]|uniref:Alpha-L-rhamnosidase C-terminal domain-containing protein n=1 Tax=Alkalicoccobacillus plakortidis TaxID=444060 RepID=A0ABT0XF22_9BACI|nr:alpha-L-rhamnosidase C-terminal domain-containing protein [Alkalicoccobacillus plakortidis]MCM2674501.1 hypothetical protein [Alkalicoccobacillus plakortidis]